MNDAVLAIGKNDDILKHSTPLWNDGVTLAQGTTPIMIC